MNREINPWEMNGVKVVKKEKFFTLYDYQCKKGKGTFKAYDLFPGVQVTFQSFNTDEVIEPYCGNKQIIEINHCLRGRVEWEFNRNDFSYIGENEFSISCTKSIPNKFCFPLNIYYGAGVIIDRKRVTEDFYRLLKNLSIDLDKITYDKLKLDKIWYTNKASGKISHIFKEIYSAKDDGEIEYFKIKVIELLYFINKLTRNSTAEFKHYSGKQVNKVKEIRGFLIKNIDKPISLNKISKDNDISLTIFRNVFKHIYGDTPYSYIKKYKMNRAAFLLATTEKNINEIAMSLGYLNASKFAEAFKNVIGVLPKEYRKKNNFSEHFK